MSKVFRSIAPGSSATVEFVGADGNVTMYVRQNIGAVDLSSDEAPAIAIAILEASGLVRDNCSADEAEISLEWLYAAVATREREAKETADREALEAEALELLNAVRASNGNASVDSLDKIAGARDPYLTVASKAREIHKAKS